MATISDIVEKLLVQTELGRVRWQKTVDSQTFLATFGDYSTLVSKGKPLSDPEYAIKILDKRGDTIERISTPYINPPGQLRSQLVMLHEAARRQALEIVEVHLDNLSKAIDLAGRT